MPHPKIIPLNSIDLLSGRLRREGRSVVLCHGCFDIVHPGHVRYMQFARQQGDALVVSLTGDDAIEKSDGTRPYVPQELRAETLAALEFVDFVTVVDGPTAEPVLRALKPDVYVKGKEYEGSTHAGFVAEKLLVEAQGGRVIFSSGDVVFSSTTMVDQLGSSTPGSGGLGSSAGKNLRGGTAVGGDAGFDDADRLATCCIRWGVHSASMRQLVHEGFAGKRVAVVGDAIADRYVFCDATGVAGEAPILSLRPLDEATYLGGAAIIAAHLRALGAHAHLMTTIADDEPSAQLIARLDQSGIEHTTLRIRKHLPEKLRYLVDTQKLVKIDRADAQPLDSSSERRLLGALAELRTQLDAVIFVDFGCGACTTPLLLQAIKLLRPHVKVITGDVSGPRRTLMAFHGADLLTPNERELRGVAGDFDNGLPAVAMDLMRRLSLANLAVTMGPRGCLLLRPREDDRAEWFRSRLRSEYLPSLAHRVVDPLGAGDALLASATLALTAGAPLTHAGYIGSAAAAIAVGRVGNIPINAADLIAFLRTRPELAAAPAPSLPIHGSRLDLVRPAK